MFVPANVQVEVDAGATASSNARRAHAYGDGRDWPGMPMARRPGDTPPPMTARRPPALWPRLSPLRRAARNGRAPLRQRHPMRRSRVGPRTRLLPPVMEEIDATAYFSRYTIPPGRDDYGHADDTANAATKRCSPRGLSTGNLFTRTRFIRTRFTGDDAASSLRDRRIGIIGAGAIGNALCRGLVQAGAAPANRILVGSLHAAHVQNCMSRITSAWPRAISRSLATPTSSCWP